MTSKDVAIWAKRLRVGGLVVSALCLAVIVWAGVSNRGVVLTPDQKALRDYRAERYDEAADGFEQRAWRAAAFYRQGEFKQAAALYSGMTSAEGIYNYGNALLMQGKYADAAGRYQRALEMRPGWEAAQVNLELAQARAKLMEKKGGEMTGGMLEADEYVFGKSKPGDQGDDVETQGGEEMSDAELQALWLRRVKTKPADFLKSKFSWQLVDREEVKP